MKCILVVDDYPTNLKFVESTLKDDYKLILVKSGQKALDYLSKNHVDLVLLDILMPEMDGFETFERIKKLEHNNDVPVVFLTADVDVDNEIKGLQMGAVDFIRKPFVPEVMLNRVNHIVQLDELNKNLENKVKEKTVQVEQLSFEIISTVASMIEAKDKYTKGHSVRVAEYSAILARALGWKDEEIKNIKYIALLHDIGKVGIPDNVLNKPGRLTDVEFDVIKAHTTIGGDILRDIKTIVDVDSGAKYHHERYDGKGYPAGLVGEHIPEVARVICIADAYDAMRSKRIYRDSMAIETIREELVKGSGTQFAPDYVAVFIKLLDEGSLEIDFGLLEKSNTFFGESSDIIGQIVKSIEEEVQKSESVDSLTGLLGRKIGETKIIQAMENEPGCLAFVDLDNLKRTNDTMGHIAGDYALKTVGEVLTEFGNNAIVARLGGDEFLFYMKGADREQATAKIEQIIEAFGNRKTESTYLSVSSLSIGLCMTTPQDVFDSVLKRADRALYHIKQSGKCGYYFYSYEVEKSKSRSTVDLEKLVANLKVQGGYTGPLSVEYREFAKIYDYVHHLGERYEHNTKLVMITLEFNDNANLYIDEREHAMKCMEKTIKLSLRSVDVSTRFSSDQFIIILFNARREDIELITGRIQECFYKIYDSKLVNVGFDMAELPISN
ncbi:MAG: diguanylate cyclase [Lachnospira sp.]|nr:diguanylate cyclase [Lachnospira sp.]